MGLVGIGVPFSLFFRFGEKIRWEGRRLDEMFMGGGRARGLFELFVFIIMAYEGMRKRKRIRLRYY